MCCPLQRTLACPQPGGMEAEARAFTPGCPGVKAALSSSQASCSGPGCSSGSTAPPRSAGRQGYTACTALSYLLAQEPRWICLMEEEMELRGTQPGCLGLQAVVAAASILLTGDSAARPHFTLGSSSLKAQVVHLDEKYTDFTQLQEKRNPCRMLHCLYSWFCIFLIVLLCFQPLSKLFFSETGEEGLCRTRVPSAYPYNC